MVSVRFNYVEEIVGLITCSLSPSPPPLSLSLSQTHTHTHARTHYTHARTHAHVQTYNIRLQKIEELAPENVVILLVGSKADLTEERAVSNEDAQAFAESSTMKYLEASAKEDTKINESFNYLVDAIIENNSKEPEVDVPKERSVKLTREPIPEPKPEEPQPTSDSGSSSRCLC